jgi:hypothetical protein
MLDPNNAAKTAKTIVHHTKGDSAKLDREKSRNWVQEEAPHSFVWTSGERGDCSMEEKHKQ